MSSPMCLACGGTMQAHSDAKGKPYAQCAPCGAQFFVRSKQGVERFTARYGTPDKKGTATAPAAPKPAATPAAPREQKPTPEGAHAEKKPWDLLDY
jgi:DNA-directed RNA polymerase subunit RPC12/RpoP